MNKLLFIPSIILGLLMSGCYCYRRIKAGKPVDNAVLVNAVLSSGGIICGLGLMAGTIFPEVKQLIPDIDIYVFISGLAVLAVSIQGLYRDVFSW